MQRQEGGAAGDVASGLATRMAVARVFSMRDEINEMLRQMILISSIVVALTTIAYIYYQEIRKKCEQEVLFLRIFVIITNFAFIAGLVVSPLVFSMLLAYYFEFNYIQKDATDIAPTAYTLTIGLLLAAVLYIAIYRLQQRSAQPPLYPGGPSVPLPPPPAAKLAE